MTKPAAPVEWATDATQTSGPESGQPPRAAPSAGYMEQGWIAGDEAPARYMNHVLGVLGDWSAYLDNLPNETDFTDENFTWGGAHTHDGNFTVLTGNDIQLDGDVYINGALSVTAIEVDLSGLYVGNNIGVNGEVVYSDGVGTSTSRPRTVMIPLACGQLSANITGVVTATLVVTSAPSYWYWPATSGQITFPLSLLGLPRGSELTSIRVGVSNQSGGSASMSCVVMGKAANKTTPSASTAAGVMSGGGSVSIPTLGDHVFTLLPLFTPLTIDNSIADYSLSIDGQVGCRVHWVEVNYNDFGPRNG